MKPNKDIIKKCLSIYGHLLPLNIKCNNYMFADLIKSKFSLNNAITHKMYNYVLKCSDLKFNRLKTGINVTIIR